MMEAREAVNEEFCEMLRQIVKRAGDVVLVEVLVCGEIGEVTDGG